MNQFEDLLRKETNTDERHTVAAEFFVGLKTAEAKPKQPKVKVKHQSPKTKKAPKAKLDEKIIAKAIKETKNNKPPAPLPKAPLLPKSLKGKTKTVFMPIEGQAVAGKTTLSKQKLPIPKALTNAPVKRPLKSGKFKEDKTVYASVEDKKKALIEAMMEKQAFLPITAGKEAVEQGLGWLGKKLTSGAKQTKAYTSGAHTAVRQDIPTRMELIAGGLKKGIEKITPNSPRLRKFLQPTIPFRRTGRSIQNFMNPRLKVAREEAEAYIKAVGPKPTGAAATPAALTKWEEAMAQATKDAKKHMAGFKQSGDLNTATGATETIGNLLRTVKDSKGKISPSSIYKGLEGSGLMTPEALMGIGTAGYKALSTARASRLAAQKHNQMMMLGGGAAGLGALALLKNRKPDTRAG